MGLFHTVCIFRLLHRSFHLKLAFAQLRDEPVLPTVALSYIHKYFLEITPSTSNQINQTTLKLEREDEAGHRRPERTLTGQLLPKRILRSD